MLKTGQNCLFAFSGNFKNADGIFIQFSVEEPDFVTTVNSELEKKNVCVCVRIISLNLNNLKLMLLLVWTKAFGLSVVETIFGIFC